MQTDLRLISACFHTEVFKHFLELHNKKSRKDHETGYTPKEVLLLTMDLHNTSEPDANLDCIDWSTDHDQSCSSKTAR